MTPQATLDSDESGLLAESLQDSLVFRTDFDHLVRSSGLEDLIERAPSVRVVEQERILLEVKEDRAIGKQTAEFERVLFVSSPAGFRADLEDLRYGSALDGGHILFNDSAVAAFALRSWQVASGGVHFNGAGRDERKCKGPDHIAKLLGETREEGEGSVDVHLAELQFGGVVIVGFHLERLFCRCPRRCRCRFGEGGRKRGRGEEKTGGF